MEYISLFKFNIFLVLFHNYSSVAQPEYYKTENVNILLYESLLGLYSLVSTMMMYKNSLFCAIIYKKIFRLNI